MICLFVALFLLVITLVRFLLNDRGSIFDMLENGRYKRVLVILAHPDDEVFIAGTLKKLHHDGARTYLLTLTCGENGSYANPTAVESLAVIRMRELAISLKELSITGHILCSLPDSGLHQCQQQVQQQILRAITKWRPEVIITHDHTIGLYGHPDHIAVSASVIDLLSLNTTSVVKVYGSTLAGNTAAAICCIGKYLNNQFLYTIGRLPKPDFSVNIFKYAHNKRKAVLAHGSQCNTLHKAFPFIGNKFWALLYFLVLDREYFYAYKLYRHKCR